MQLLILTLILLFSLGFFVLAYFQKESERGGYAMLSGFVLILTAGLLVAASGIDYRSGDTTVTDNMTATAVRTYDYAPVNVLERSAIALPLILAGFWGALVCVAAMRDN